MIFFRIFLTFLLVTSTWPFAWGWYGVVTRWWTPYFLSKLLKWELVKWDPPSLIIVLGKPNQEKILLTINLLITRWSSVLVGIASTHLDTVHRYKNVLFSLRRWKWSHKVNPPKDKKFLPQGWFAKVFHLALRCSMRICTLDILCNTWSHPWIDLANRSHFVAILLPSLSMQNVLHIEMSDTLIEYALVPPSKCIAE